MHAALALLLLAATASQREEPETVSRAARWTARLDPGRHRYFFVGGTSGLDPGFFGLRLGVTPLPEVSVELHAGLLLIFPVLGVDVRVRPLARFSALTPTVRYGLGFSVTALGPLCAHTFAGGLEWNFESGLILGLDAGASFLGSTFVLDGRLRPLNTLATVPTGQLSIGWRL